MLTRRALTQSLMGAPFVLAGLRHAQAQTTPAADWAFAKPDGFNAAGFAEAEAKLVTMPTTALMVVTGGRVVYRYGDIAQVSYLASARKKGLTGYQFRAPGEWFAELYAAYRSGKLKDNHPSVGWLSKLKTG